MARLPRNVLPDYGVFHVTVRGVDRCVIYRDVEDYRFFMSLFRRVVAREKLRVEAFCLMPNHFHAIVEGDRDALSRAMKRLNGI
jgi:REP element-mobilizing transposase RayT